MTWCSWCWCSFSCCCNKDTGSAIVEKAGPPLLLAGRCLLELGQHIDAVAPLAFMVGSVIQACRRASVLQKDCQEFAMVVEMVEVAICKCTNLDDQLLPVIQKVQDTLDEAMIHVNLCSSRSRLGKLVFGFDDSAKFHRWSRQLYDVCTMLQFEQVVDLTSMVQQQYAQSATFHEQIQALGGADQVCQNEDLLDQLLSTMEDGTNRLTLQAATEARRQSGQTNQGIQEIKAALGTQSQQLTEIQRTWTEQSKFDTDLRIMKEQNDLLVNQVMQMQHMMMEQSMKLSQFMSLFPMCHDEVYRQRVIDSRNLIDIDFHQMDRNGKVEEEEVEDGKGTMEQICIQALAELKNLVVVALAIVGRELDMFHICAIWIPDSYQPKKGVEIESLLVPVPGRSGGSVVFLRKFLVPRKLDCCQHTVTAASTTVPALRCWIEEECKKVLPDRFAGPWMDQMTWLLPEFQQGLDQVMTHPTAAPLLSSTCLLTGRKTM